MGHRRRAAPPAPTWPAITITQSRTDRLISRSVIPFMRPISIGISGQRFRPHGQVDVYFNGENVNASVTQAGKVTPSDPIVADATGNIAATFVVPAQRFRTGLGTLILSDDLDAASSTSYGRAFFSSEGNLEVRQANVTTTTIITNPPPPPESSGGALVGGGGGAVGGDPLAQTFFVNTKTASPGCFITKIDCFFQAKDPVETIELELRNVVNGYPGGTVLARAVRQSADVNLSTNSLAVTSFVFDRPTFVSNNLQYSFVLKTNSTRYFAWVAQMGQVRVDKNESVAKQPNAGVMFVSSNDTTWSPDQLSDVKFKVWVAQFSTSPATVYLAPTFPQYRTSHNGSVYTTNASNTVRIFAAQHGLEVGSTTKVSVVGFSGATTINNIPVSEMNGIKTVTAIDAISFSFAATTNANATGFVICDSITYEPNARADGILPLITADQLEGTSIKYSLKGISGRSINGTQTPFVEEGAYTPFENNTILDFDEPKLVCSYNETAARFGGVVSSRIKVEMQTDDPFVSPMFRLDNSGIVAVNYFVNDPTWAEDFGGPETSATKNGSSVYRYVTKPIGVETPATALKVLFAGNIVNGNNVDVYYRTVGSAEDIPLSAKEWVQMTVKGGMKFASVRDEFLDYEYEVTTLPEYVTYQIKIVPRGKRSSVYPKFKDLRILALAV